MGKSMWRSPKSEGEVEIVEIDEIHTYVGSKKALLDMDSC
jgi:hypothetical protein